MTNAASRFHALFAPGETGHGVYTLIGDGVREDCSTEGKLDRADKYTCGRVRACVVHKNHENYLVTPELWEKHLSGEQGLGIIPIRKDGTVCWGAIDIDIYDGLDIVKLAATLLHLSLPVIPCWTKSGGVHLYLFTSEPVTAAAMQIKLREVAAMLGHGGVEVFPKQTRLLEHDEGSWINVPYFNGAKTTRFAVLPDGEPLTVEQFLDLAETTRVSVDFFKATADKAKKAKEIDAFPDGPPCLNYLATLGFPTGTIDNGLVAIGVYYKKSTPNWQAALEEANRRIITEPATSADIVRITKSLANKDYNYSCNKHPLQPYCNRSKCQTRKFGVGSGESSFPVLGELRKLPSDPPVYFWDIVLNDITHTVQCTHDQVHNPREFKRRVSSACNWAVPQLKQPEWDNIVNETYRTRFKELAPLPANSTAPGQLWELIEVFCTLNPALSQEEMLLGKPWTSEGRTYIRVRYLMLFLSSQQFKELGLQEVTAQLSAHSMCEHGQFQIKGKCVQWWSLPEFDVQTEGFEVREGVGKNESPF